MLDASCLMHRQQDSLLHLCCHGSTIAMLCWPDSQRFKSAGSNRFPSPLLGCYSKQDGDATSPRCCRSFTYTVGTGSKWCDVDKYLSCDFTRVSDILSHQRLRSTSILDLTVPVRNTRQSSFYCGCCLSLEVVAN